LNNIYVGFGLSDITPRSGYAMGGFQSRKNFLLSLMFPRKSKGTADSLEARAISLKTRNQHLIMISLDVIAFYKDEIDLIKAGIWDKLGKVKILVASTHTHGSPDFYGIYGGSPKKLKKMVIEKAVEAAIESTKNMKPAKTYVGVFETEGLCLKSHTMEPVNPKIYVINFRESKENGTATITNFACHPNVSGPKNKSYTSDFVHSLRNKLESNKKMGKIIYFNGAVGDVHPKISLQDLTGERGLRGIEEAYKFGEKVAGAIKTEELREIKVETVNYVSKEILVEGENKILRLFRTLGIVRRKLIEGKVPTEVAILNLNNEVGMAAIPGQPFYQLGQEIEKELPGEIGLTLGLANDEIAYILPPQEFGKGFSEERFSLGKNTWNQIKENLKQIMTKINT